MRGVKVFMNVWLLMDFMMRLFKIEVFILFFGFLIVILDIEFGGDDIRLVDVGG